MSISRVIDKRSHVASSPSVWIDKDFWFQSSPFPPSPLFHFFPSLSPLSLCVFLASKDWERKRERAIAKKITEEERKREKEIALV